MATNTSKIGFYDLDNEVNEKIGSIATLESRPVNNNLLINSNFANPVNQRGVTAETWNNNGGNYGIDHWRVYNAEILSIENGVKFKVLNHQMGGLYQHVEFKTLPNKPISVSACINGVVYSGNGTKLLSSKTDESFTIGDVVLGVISSFFSDQYQYIDVYAYGTDSSKEYNIDWVKAEYGNHATPYVPRLYAEEFALCEWYYSIEKIHDSILFVMNTGELVFEKTLKKMRLPMPTTIIDDGNVRSDGVLVGGFTFKVNVYDGFVDMIATKANHGLNSDNILQIVGRII